MKFIKSSVLLGLASLMLAFSTPAATVTFPLGNTTTAQSLVHDQSLLLTKLDIVNNGGSSCVISLFSAPTNVLTKNFGAYTNSTLTSGSTTVITTNVLGNRTTNTYSTVTSALGSVASYTYTYPKLYTTTVAAGATVSVTMSPPLVFMQGLCATNSQTNVTFTATYIPGF